METIVQANAEEGTIVPSLPATEGETPSAPMTLKEAQEQLATVLAEHHRQGYEARKAEAERKAAEAEAAAIAQQAEQQRQTQTEEQRQTQEALETTKAENEQLKRENTISKIASEFKLPEVLAKRLQGVDEAELRADAEQLAQLLPARKAGRAVDPVREPTPPARRYTRAELRADAKLAASEDVRKAWAEGRIVG